MKAVAARREKSVLGDALPARTIETHTLELDGHERAAYDTLFEVRSLARSSSSRCVCFLLATSRVVRKGADLPHAETRVIAKSGAPRAPTRFVCAADDDEGSSQPSRGQIHSARRL